MITISKTPPSSPSSTIFYGLNFHMKAFESDGDFKRDWPTFIFVNFITAANVAKAIEILKC